jgi:hypothetical protein
MRKEGINTYIKVTTSGGYTFPKSYIHDFKYSMVENLFNLFGALIIDRDGIMIYDDYVE